MVCDECRKKKYCSYECRRRKDEKLNKAKWIIADTFANLNNTSANK